MIAAVFDCNVFFQAYLSKGPAHAILTLAEEKWVTLHVSFDIVREAREVLLRPVFQRKYSKITPERVDEYFARITEFALLATEVPHIFPLPRDPKDEPYLNLALAMEVQFLVTRDRDLLSLMDSKPFTKKFPWLAMVEPQAFLRHVRAEVSKALGYE